MANSIERMVDGEKIIFRYPFETRELVLKSFLFKTHRFEMMPIGDDKDKNLDTSDPNVVWVPFPYFNVGSEESIYDGIIDGSIIGSEDGLVKNGNRTKYGSEGKYIVKHWKEYKAIVDSRAYTKEGGFDVQKVKEALNPIIKPTDEIKPNENTKSPANDESLDPNAIIEESIKTFNAKYAELGGNPDSLDDPVIFEKALNFVIDGNFDVTTKNLAKEAIDYIKSRRK